METKSDLCWLQSLKGFRPGQGIIDQVELPWSLQGHLPPILRCWIKKKTKQINNKKRILCSYSPDPSPTVGGSAAVGLEARSPEF